MEASDSSDAGVKVARDRSPSYPFISLKTAIERLQSFERSFGRHPAKVDKAGVAWGMKEKSSTVYQTVSALSAFGLLVSEGAKEQRTVVISEMGRNYLRAQQDVTKQQVLKACALRPKMIRFYWAKWASDRPIDAACLDELILGANFTESAAKTFLRVYDDTIAFAGLGSGDSIATSGEADEGEPSGDAVLIGAKAPAAESAPLKEQTMSAIPSPSPPQTANSAAVAQSASMKQDTFSLDEGTAVLQWPTSMSEHSYEDFKDWLELQLRKIKRTIQ